MLLNPPEAPLAPGRLPAAEEVASQEKSPKGGVLVVGVDSLMTQLAQVLQAGAAGRRSAGSSRAARA
jgi:hypothetical protein